MPSATLIAPCVFNSVLASDFCKVALIRPDSSMLSCRLSEANKRTSDCALSDPVGPTVIVGLTARMLPGEGRSPEPFARPPTHCSPVARCKA